MKTTISKLNAVLPPPSSDPAHSDTSSSPVHSQTTSPTRELSPPSAGPTSDSMLKGLQALGLADEQVGVSGRAKSTNLGNVTAFFYFI